MSLKEIFGIKDKSPTPEQLSQELFIHLVLPQNEYKVIEAIQRGIPLFGLDGRATINRGTISLLGVNLVYRIPTELQSEFFELPRRTRYEEIVVRDGQLLALRQPVPPRYKKASLEWMQTVDSPELVLPLWGRDIPSEDIRYLPLGYLACAINVSRATQISQWVRFPEEISLLREIPNQPGINVKSLTEAMRLYVNSL